MSTIYDKNIKPHICELIRVLDPSELLPELFSGKIITKREQEKIERLIQFEGVTEANTHLLTNICHRKEKCCLFILNYLRENGYHELLKKIDEPFFEKESKQSLESCKNVQDVDGNRKHQSAKTYNHDKAETMIKKENDQQCPTSSTEEQPSSSGQIPRNRENIKMPVQETGTVPNREQLEMPLTQVQSKYCESIPHPFYIPNSNYNADCITREVANLAIHSPETHPKTAD